MNLNERAASAADFLRAQFGNCTTGYINFRIQAKSGVARNEFHPIATATSVGFLTRFLAKTQNEHLYFGTSLFKDASNGQKANVSVCAGFFADVDLLHPNKGTTNLPATEKDIWVALEASGFPMPTLIVFTGRGYHFYWLLDVPIEVNEANRTFVHNLKRSVGAVFLDMMQGVAGYEFDRGVFDITRIARFPGSFNVKEDVPIEVTWRMVTEGRTYSLQEMEDVAALAPTKPSKQRQDIAVAPASTPRAPGVAEAWRSVFLSEHQPKQKDVPLKPNFAAITAGCSWAKHTVDEAANLSYAEWFAMLNIASRCYSGDEIAHAVSAPHPTYDRLATIQKLDEVSRADGPVTCEYVRKGLNRPECAVCPFRERVKTPLSIGERGRARVAVNLMKKYAYVAVSDAFFPLDRANTEVRENGITGAALSAMHASVLPKAAQFILSDPLCAKAYARIYEPGLPSGIVGGADPLLNSYVPPTLRSAAGEVDWFIQYVSYLFGDTADHVMKYIAHLAQFPDVKIRHAILIQSRQGLGKGLLFNLLRRVFGEENCRSAETGELTGRYQARLGNHVFLLLNELSAEDRQLLYNTLKPIISDETFSAEDKFVHFREVRTPSGMFVYTNRHTPLRIERDDQRFLVVDRFDQAKDSGLTAAFANRIRNEAEAVAHYLRNLDLKGFDPNADPPLTEGKLRLIEGSRSKLERRLVEAAERAEGPWANEIACSSEINDWIAEIGFDVSPGPIGDAMRLVGAARPASDKPARVRKGEYRDTNQRFWILKNHEQWQGCTIDILRDEFEERQESHPRISNASRSIRERMEAGKRSA